MTDVAVELLDAGLMMELGHAAWSTEVQGALPIGLHVYRGVRIRGTHLAQHLTVVIATHLGGALAESAARYAKVVISFSGEAEGSWLLALLGLLDASFGCLNVSIEACEHLAALVGYRKESVKNEEGPADSRVQYKVERSQGEGGTYRC